MDTVEYTYGPKTIHLYMSAAAMFDIQALNVSEDQPDVMDRILPNTAEATRLLCQVASILARAGELCRRHLGYTPERIPPDIELQNLLTPMQMVRLRSLVFKAVDQGYRGDDHSDNGDIDLGLIELEKKTKL